MTTIRYIGPFAGGVDTAEGDHEQHFARDEPTDCPPEIAGRTPKGEPTDEDYDPGEGLLAQVANFEIVTTKTATATKTKESTPDA